MDTKPKRTLAALHAALAYAKEEQTNASRKVREIEHEISLRRYVPIPGFTKVLMSKEDLSACAKEETQYCVYFYDEKGRILGTLNVIRSETVGQPAYWGLSISRNRGYIGFEEATSLGSTMTMMEAAQMAATILSEGLWNEDHSLHHLWQAQAAVPQAQSRTSVPCLERSDV